MLPIYLLTWVTVALGVFLCVTRPNWGRIFAGFFYIAAAGLINMSLLFTHPGLYAVFFSGARFPLYRLISAATMAVNPVLYMLLLILFLSFLGLLLLSGGRMTKAGLIVSGLFLISLAPIDPLLYPWLLLAAAHLYLAPQRFEGLWLRRFQPATAGD